MASIEIIGGANNAPKETEKPKDTEGKKTNKLIKLIKKNPFLVAVVAVSVLGLYAFFKKSNSTETEDSEGYSAVGYTYPTYAGGGTYPDSNRAYSEDLFNTMQEAFQQQAEDLATSYDNRLEQIQQSYDTSTSNLVSQLDKLNDRINDNEDTLKKQSEAVEMVRDIDTMRRNSDSYHYASTQQAKDALHQQNANIAEKWGFTFNNSDGYWYDKTGNRVYSTVTQEQKALETIATKPSSSSNSSSKKSSSSNSSSGSSKKSSSSSSSSKPYIKADGTVVGDKSKLSSKQYIGKDGKWRSV